MAEGDEVTVLGVWPIPFAIAVRVALNVKGVRHAYAEEDLVRCNPAYHKVPVLIHNGRAVCDSRVILQYIDEAWPDAVGPPILPREPCQRAAARFWAGYVHDEVDPPWRAFARARTDEAKVRAVARLVSALDTLETAFQDLADGTEERPFFGGDTVGYVDAVLGGFLPWFGAIEEMVGGGSVRLIDAARTPLLAAWAERFRGADALRGVVPCDAGRVVVVLWSTSGRFSPGGPVRQACLGSSRHSA